MIMVKTISELAKECQLLIDDNFRLLNQSLMPIINGRRWQVPYYAVWSDGTADKLLSLLEELHSAIINKYPMYANELRSGIDSYSKHAPVALGEIGVILNLISASESNSGGKKIFISHSSQDKDIVKWFVKEILHSGIGISYDDICCTSIEGLNVRHGDDIRRHIHDNIKGADFSFLMISNNYKTSKICLNEMGAVWAYDANVRAFLLPNINFESIGWLNDPKEAKQINCSISLDALKDELVEYYSLKDPKTDWSRGRQDFLDNLNMLKHLQEI